MSDPASKRRKISGSNALLKPFKSPMRNQDITSSKLQTQQTSLPPKKQDSNRSFVARLQQLKSTGRDNEQTKELSQLRREELSLISQISKLKAELGQVKQAQSIEESNKEKELMDLIKVWQAASQQAAEEVYGIFRDKVNAMGGLRRWTEMEKERENNAFPMEEVKEKTEEDVSDREEGLDPIQSQEELICDEREESKTLEPETLSMDVMLRYMKIEPRIIGYDIENQRWSV